MIFENVEKLCSRKQMSVTKLERELGFGVNTIRKWETSSPTVANLQKVAKYFNVTIDSLLKPIKE